MIAHKTSESMCGVLFYVSVRILKRGKVDDPTRLPDDPSDQRASKVGPTGD